VSNDGIFFSHKPTVSGLARQIVDDGSPILPDWSDIAVTDRLDSHELSGDATLYHFDVRLGRQALSVYPGWYRSFCFAAKFAEQFQFDKIIHIESDVFIISPKMQNYVNSVSDAWVAPVIESHRFPESAIQIIARRQVSAFFPFARIPGTAPSCDTKAWTISRFCRSRRSSWARAVISKSARKRDGR